VLLTVGIVYSVIVPTSAAAAAEHIATDASVMTTGAMRWRETKSGASLHVGTRHAA
jgi:hypothetical protein